MERVSRRVAVSAMLAAASILCLPHVARAETVVRVSLWDKGATSMDGADSMMPMGMGMADAKMESATMGITAAPSKIPAGPVSFRIVNDSAEFYHGLVIAAVADQSVPLPYLADTKMVDEAAAGALARSKELRPHDAGTVKVELKPGSYILFCNVAGHYMMGMWTVVTVVP